MIVDEGNNDEDGHNDEDNEEEEEEEECDDTHVDDDANIIDDAPSTSSTTTTATTTTTLNTAIYPLLMIALIRRHLRFRSRMMKCLTVALSETKFRNIIFWTTINGGGLIPLQLPPGTTTQQQQHKRMRDSGGRQTDGDDDDDMGLKTSSPPPPPKHNKLEPADFDNSIGFTATTDIYDLNQSPPPPPSSQQHAFRPESFISLMVCDLDDAINTTTSSTTTTPPEQQQQQQLQHLDVPSEEILQDWETQLLYEQMLRHSRLLRLVPSHRRERR